MANQKPNQPLKAYRPESAVTPFKNKSNVAPASPKQPAAPKSATLKRPTIIKSGGFQKMK
jgi:hypothetical protein